MLFLLSNVIYVYCTKDRSCEVGGLRIDLAQLRVLITSFRLYAHVSYFTFLSLVSNFLFCRRSERFSLEIKIPSLGLLSTFEFCALKIHQQKYVVLQYLLIFMSRIICALSQMVHGEISPNFDRRYCYKIYILCIKLPKYRFYEWYLSFLFHV